MLVRPGPCPAFWMQLTGAHGTEALDLDVLDATCLLTLRKVPIQLLPTQRHTGTRRSGASSTTTKGHRRHTETGRPRRKPRVPAFDGARYMYVLPDRSRARHELPLDARGSRGSAWLLSLFGSA